MAMRRIGVVETVSIMWRETRGVRGVIVLLEFRFSASRIMEGFRVGVSWWGISTLPAMTPFLRGHFQAGVVRPRSGLSGR